MYLSKVGPVFCAVESLVPCHALSVMRDPFHDTEEGSCEEERKGRAICSLEDVSSMTMR